MTDGTERGGSVFSLHSFMSYALYVIMSYCAFMDIRRYRIPNRALAAAAAAGLAVSVEAWVSGAGNVGLWAAGIGFWMQDTGFWAAAGRLFWPGERILVRCDWFVSGSCSGSRKDAARGQHMSEILVFNCLYQACDSE